jgi:DNA-binding MarR family transcriptional regulator
MVRARDDELRQIGLTSVQAAILYIVKVVKDPVTPATLSRWLFREAHTVSAILDRMEKQGLVKKVKDLPRKNIVRVTLTEKGEEAYKKSSETKSIRNIMSCLSPEELDTLRGYMERLRNKAIEEPQRTPRWQFP